MPRELPRNGQSQTDASSPANDVRVRRSNAENTLVVRGEPGAVSSYQITVSERIRPDAGETAVGTSRAVEDAVREGRRRYAFSGSITDLRIDGPAMVFVNGEPFSPRAAANAE